jgi:hypothetical protein
MLFIMVCNGCTGQLYLRTSGCQMSGRNSLMFQRNISPPSSESNNKLIKKACHLLSQLVSCWAYSSTLKMELMYSSETSVDFQWAAQRYIPEDSTLDRALN